jgi:fructose-1-phosphate kinase PfkB-like protein
LQVIDETHPLPLLVSAVSESKVGRILEVRAKKEGELFDVIVMNEREARALCSGAFNLGRAAQELRVECGTAALVVTLGADGYIVVENNAVRHFQTAVIPNIVNTLGAGDAVLAAISAHRARNSAMDWDRCSKEIQVFVNRILGLAQATPQITSKAV